MPDSPRLARSTPAAKVGIVHFGPGAFFRAFGAIYTHEAMAQAGGDWGILAVSLKSATARDQLAAQGCAYTSVTLKDGARQAQVIEAISDVMVAPEDPAAVIEAMADPAVKIVSLTITEKGYCHDPASGALNLAHPDIAHDLAHPGAPRSAIGFIVAALDLRRARGLGAFTVLSCDNLPANGEIARASALAFAEARGAELADWVAAHARFPASMVDRITPATTEAVVAQLEADEGYTDPACIAHEAFRQWVIEDDFACGRPKWDLAGAQFVRSVEAHELMKLRCLNGTHSTLAYLGYLAGHETIADCVADPVFEELCEILWEIEIVPTLRVPDGEDLGAYCARLMARYRDASIRHRTWQIAMDGSQKLPQRILGTIRDNLKKDIVPRGLCLAVAGWMRYVGGVDEAGQPIDVKDPLAERLRQTSDGAEDKAGALLQMQEIFGADLEEDPRFAGAVRSAYAEICRVGARAAVAAFAAREMERSAAQP